MKAINIFYSEPDPDRWFKLDRYPRNLVRRLYRGKPVRGGHYMMYYNLVKGLIKLGIPYRLNDYKYIKKHNDEVAWIIGKDHVLFENEWKCPIVFGPAFGINPLVNPDILKEFPIKKIVVPGLWVEEMFLSYGKENLEIGPVGIDTDLWAPAGREKKYQFLIYNKIRWEQETMQQNLVNPILTELTKRNISYIEIKYGTYKPEYLKQVIGECWFSIFLCEHETQGLAYQQILSSGLPILAWDRGGYWQDPSWFPDKIMFRPVSSVPYWDKNCGVKFSSFADFGLKLSVFLELYVAKQFKPREYILQNLTLEKCAAKYVEIIASIENVTH